MILSIIIPLYNKEKYIEYCLKSVVSQDLPSSEYEIIVIDDGSTDSSAEIAEGFACQHSNVHFSSQENQGLSATRNRALDVAKGDFVYFLDADDYLASNTLSELTNIAKSHKLDILGFKSLNVNDYDHTTSTQVSLANNSIEVMDGISFIGKNKY